jgi:hypothetical protein
MACIRVAYGVLLVVLLTAASASATHGDVDEGSEGYPGVPPLPGLALLELPPRDNLESGRRALERWEAAAAGETGLLRALLGGSCFSAAVASLRGSCAAMDAHERCWLAIQFMRCFQRASGMAITPCPATCRRGRALSTCVASCTAAMDEKAHITYTQFFGDVLKCVGAKTSYCSKTAWVLSAAPAHSDSRISQHTHPSPKTPPALPPLCPPCMLSCVPHVPCPIKQHVPVSADAVISAGNSSTCAGHARRQHCRECQPGRGAR